MSNTKGERNKEEKKRKKKNELLPVHNLIISRPSLVNVASFCSPMTLVLDRIRIYVSSYTCV